MSNQSVSSPSTLTAAFVSVYRALMMLQSFSDTPYCARISSSASLLTVSYAAFRSTKHIYSGFLSRFACSIILRRLKIWSAHPLAFLKPAWHSDIFGSTTATSLLRMMCVNTLPTTLSRLMPLQLSQILLSPFLNNGTTIARSQSSGISSDSHILFITLCIQRLKILPPAFSVSELMLSNPGALWLFSCLIALLTSSSVGASSFLFSRGPSKVCTPFSTRLSTFRRFLKCRIHRSFLSTQPCTTVPSSFRSISACTDLVPLSSLTFWYTALVLFIFAIFSNSFPLAFTIAFFAAFVAAIHSRFSFRYSSYTRLFFTSPCCRLCHSLNLASFNAASCFISSVSHSTLLCFTRPHTFKASSFTALLRASQSHTPFSVPPSTWKRFSRSNWNSVCFSADLKFSRSMHVFVGFFWVERCSFISDTTKRWSELLNSAPRYTRVSWTADNHVLRTIMWSIWLLKFVPRWYHVYLWMFLCGKKVPVTLSPPSLQKSKSRIPLSFFRGSCASSPKPCLPTIPGQFFQSFPTRALKSPITTR